jgi:hypothetical protein
MQKGKKKDMETTEIPTIPSMRRPETQCLDGVQQASFVLAKKNFRPTE